MRVDVRVIPRSSKNEITWEGDTLKARLTAPPVDGAANTALLTLLAERLHIPKHALRIIHGAAGRHKIVEIEGVSSAEIRQRFS